MGRAGSIFGINRWTWRIDAVELEVDTDDSGAVYIPPSRNDLILDIRKSDDAEGESKMMGSGRRFGALALMATDVLLATLPAAGC